MVDGVNFQTFLGDRITQECDKWSNTWIGALYQCRFFSINIWQNMINLGVNPGELILNRLHCNQWLLQRSIKRSIKEPNILVTSNSWQKDSFSWLSRLNYLWHYPYFSIWEQGFDRSCIQTSWFFIFFFFWEWKF